MDKRMKIGVVGVGGMGGSHVSAIANQPELFDLVAIAEPNHVLAGKVRDKFKLESEFYENITAMLHKTPELEAVVIAPPHDLHVVATESALRMGVSVLCEKPGSINAAEFKIVEEAIRISGPTYALGFCKRYLRMVEQAELLIKSGVLGQVSHIVFNDEWRHRALHDLFEEAAFNGQPNWRAERKRMGDLGIGNDTSAHAMSMLLALINHQPHEVLMVDARGNKPIYLNMEGADALDIRLAFGPGGQGRAIANTSWAYNAGGEPMLRVHGTQGQLVGRFAKGESGEELEQLEFTSFGPYDDNPSIFTWPKESELRRQLRDFRYCIRHGIEPRNGINHAREFVAMRTRVFGLAQSVAVANGHGALAIASSSGQ